MLTKELNNFLTLIDGKINQPIVLSELQTMKYNDVEGVLSVNNITITNDDTYSSKDYSGNRYNIGSGTMNGIVYPSLTQVYLKLNFLTQIFITTNKYGGGG